MVTALTFPYDPDSGRLDPVTVRSRIRVAGGDAVLLKDTIDVAVEPGSGWEGLVMTAGHQLIDGRRAARFEAAIKEGMSLAQCAALVIPRVPVRLKVTLTPDMQVPAPGIPLSVPAPVPPQTRVIPITIPPIAPGKIELDTVSLPDDPSGRPRGGIRAWVSFPSFVRPTADELRAVQHTLSFTETGGQSAVIPGPVSRETDGSVTREYTALASRETMEGARVTVEVTATVCGILLRSSAQLSFAPRRVFQPYIVPPTLAVAPAHPSSFAALVREILPDGQETDVPDASIEVTIPASATEILSIQPVSAIGRLSATVTQKKAGSPDPVRCPVVFQVGNDRHEDAVTITPGRREGILEVEFSPPEKNSVNPYLASDSVILRARVRDVPATISYARGAATRWLDDPSSPVAHAEGWIAVRISATPPEPGSSTPPPESEPVIVTAFLDGRVIAEEQVAIRFTMPPVLDASPGEIRLPAGREGEERTVVLTLRGSAPGTWRFELEEEESASLYLSVSDPVVRGSTATFTVKLSGEVPPSGKATGPSSWQTLYILHPRATDGTNEIEGPDVRVLILREGLFVEKIFAVDEKNQYKTSEQMTVLPLRVDLPYEDRRRVARVKLVAMVWDGTDLVRDEGATRGDSLTWDTPVCTADDCRKWETIFSGMKATIVATDQDEVALEPHSDLSGTWGLSLDRVIPGHGEKLPGEITAACDAGSVTIPLVLRLGDPPDEKTRAIEKERERCIRIIENCIPKPYRKVLLDDLERLPCKGARDYQVYARQVYDTAWKIWAEDQKDYQYWENGWGYYLFAGAEYAKKAGDLAFNLLVGYATSSLGPAYAYGASTMASEFKDQGLEFYAYYVAHADEKDFRTCIIDFVNERFEEFLIALATGAVDTVILQGIDIRNPKTYTRLAWLWLWKIETNYARDPEAGLLEAMIAAGKEVAMASGMLLLQEFVNTHGRAKLRELHTSVREKGWLGPGHAGGEEGEGPKKKPEEEAKPKKEEKKPEEEAKPKKPGEREKTGEEKYKERIEAERKKAKKEADDYVERGKEFTDPAAKAAFEQGRIEGRKKVDRLKAAAEELSKNPSDPDAQKKFADACEEVQKDKHAMHELNDIDPNKPNKMREEFNEFWKRQYEKVDQQAKQRIADELNKNLKPGEKPYTADDIELASVTNTPPRSPAEDSVKSTFDRDITYRNKRTGKDISTEISEPIYNHEFYKQMHGGKEPPSAEAARKFAEECDQTVTDRFHRDAYGGGKEDIGPAVDAKQKGKPFKDVEASAKTMEDKVLEWYKRAGGAKTPAEAEACKEEGMRQLTKQFKNQIEGRIDKVNEIMGYPDPPVAKVPPKLRAAVDVMNRVGTKGPDGKTFTVADAEAALRQMGTSPRKVVHEMSGILEGIQKHTPPDVKRAVEKHVRELEAGNVIPQ